MIQPIDLRLKDSKTQDYFAQMRQQQEQQKNNTNTLQHSQLEVEIEQVIEYSLENNDVKKLEKEENKVGTSGLTENLNKLANMNSVVFQFEFIESNDAKIEERKKELILKVIDKETKEVIRQYPAEISVKIAKMLDKLIGRGQLTDAEA